MSEGFSKIQLLSTGVGLASAYLIIRFWKKKRTEDPGSDPLGADGNDPNFPGGKPIYPQHPHDSNDFKIPSCQIYNPTLNLFENLGNPALDKSVDACFDNVAQGSEVRYVDENGKLHWLNDSIFNPAEVSGTCFFLDRNNKIFSFPPFEPVNRSQRTCFNASDTIGGSAAFFAPTPNPGVRIWNPEIEFQTVGKTIFLPMAADGKWIKSDGSDALDPKDNGETDCCQTLQFLQWAGSGDFRETFMQVYLRDYTLPVDAQKCVVDEKTRLYLPSQGKYVYWDKYSKSLVEYPILQN